MKLRNLLFASVALAGLFTACSSELDEVVDNNGNGTNNAGEAYASFAIQVPSAAGTRAAAGTEEGTAAENGITDVNILFFDATSGNLTDNMNLPIAKFVKNNGTYTLNDPFLVTKGERKIYAFVNAQPAIKGLVAGVNISTIEGIGTETAASMSSANGFTMSNADAVSATSVTFATKTEAQANPVQMKVERSVAKIAYTGAATPAFDVKSFDGNSTIGNVKLTDVQVVNMNSKYYYLRRVSSATDGLNPTIGGAEVDGVNYVVDPNFTEKYAVSYPANEFTHSGYTSLAANYTSYCLENTMTKASQFNSVTTGLMFKAQIKLEGENAVKSFYRYNGVIYKDIASIKAAAGLTEADAVLGAWDAKAWKAKNVDFFKDGICYYPYWIKHVPAAGDEMGVMEFGVVRNNVYKFSVTSIKAIGQPTDEIDPENPDKNKDSYISVALEVKKWTVRSNENIEL